MKNYSAVIPHRQAFACPGLRAAKPYAFLPALRTSAAGGLCALLLVSAGMVLAPAPARAASSADDEIRLLREQIELLSKKIDTLEKRQAMTDADEAAAARTTPKVTAGPAGIVVASADKAFSLKLGALVQTDARVFLDDGASNRDGFLLRRIRTPLTGTVSKIFSFNITPEYAGGSNTSSSASLVDAWFSATLTPAFGLKAGKFTLPVVLEPGGNRHFNEAPFINTLAPNRDIGIEAFGTLASGFVDYRLGLFNGASNNNQSFGGGSPGLDDGDFTTSGRLTVLPFKKSDGPLSKLALSLGGDFGNKRGTSAANGLTAIVSNGQQTILNWGSLLADGEHTHISPGLEWYTGTPFSLVAEFLWERQDLTNGSTFTKTVTNTGWRVSAGYVLTGEPAAKAGVTPAKPFNWENGTWGAFEVVARVSGFDMDDDLFTGAGSLSSSTNVTGAFAYGAGLNWYLNQNVRLLFSVEKTEYDGGGSASTLKGAQADELYLFTRLQLQF
ncbi:phosphate-selective porin [Opitutaceae bacterium TAV1]|nr:phosphate-selective porin [Opitutaceae bacterium TAV1]